MPRTVETPDPDPAVRALRKRFTAISRSADRRRLGRSLTRKTWRGLTGILAAGAALFALAQLSPWPLQTTIRHLAASPNCQTARAVGLAPSSRGQPGYWPWLDADHDGIACEPWRTHARGW
jgi:Excalibur calcium-binding domain.